MGATATSNLLRAKIHRRDRRIYTYKRRLQGKDYFIQRFKDACRYQVNELREEVAVLQNKLKAAIKRLDKSPAELAAAHEAELAGLKEAHKECVNRRARERAAQLLNTCVSKLRFEIFPFYTYSLFFSRCLNFFFY